MDLFLYFFELNLIKDLGYDTNFKQFDYDMNDLETKNIKIDNYNFEVPGFLISNKVPKTYNKDLIRKSLYFTRNIILNRFFIPNNLVFPKSRIILENYFN